LALACAAISATAQPSNNIIDNVDYWLKKFRERFPIEQPAAPVHDDIVWTVDRVTKEMVSVVPNGDDDLLLRAGTFVTPVDGYCAYYNICSFKKHTKVFCRGNAQSLLEAQREAEEQAQITIDCNRIADRISNCL